MPTEFYPAMHYCEDLDSSPLLLPNGYGWEGCFLVIPGPLPLHAGEFGFVHLFLMKQVLQPLIILLGLLLKLFHFSHVLRDLKTCSDWMYSFRYDPTSAE